MGLPKKGYGMVILLCALLLLPSISLAAYQNPTITANTKQADGSIRLTFRFTGNAGELVVNRDYQVNADTTATAVRNWVDDTIKELDFLQTAASLPSVQPGQTVTRLARTVPAPTAQQVWARKLHRYLTIKDSGLAGSALASDVAALKADLEATYQAGHLNGVD